MAIYDDGGFYRRETQDGRSHFRVEWCDLCGDELDICGHQDDEREEAIEALVDGYREREWSAQAILREFGWD